MGNRASYGPSRGQATRRGLAPGQVLPVPDRSVVLYYLRQRCRTRRIALPVGRTSTIYCSDDGDEDQGEGQPGFREGDGDSDPAVPSSTAWAQLWSYAVLLEVLRNNPTRCNLGDSQIFDQHQLF